jgi:hypothetical protein
VKQTVVKTYKGKPGQIQRAFERDMQKMAEQGYEVASQSTLPGKRGGCLGCLGVLTVGLIWLFVRPDDRLIVTYKLSH